MRDKQQKEDREAEQRQADWEQAESHRKPGDRPANAEAGRTGSTAPKPQSRHDTLRRMVNPRHAQPKPHAQPKI